MCSRSYSDKERGEVSLRRRRRRFVNGILENRDAACDRQMICRVVPMARSWLSYMIPHLPLSLSRPKRDPVFFPSSWRDMLRRFSISNRAWKSSLTLVLFFADVSM